MGRHLFGMVKIPLVLICLCLFSVFSIVLAMPSSHFFHMVSTILAAASGLFFGVLNTILVLARLTPDLQAVLTSSSLTKLRDGLSLPTARTTFHTINNHIAPPVSAPETRACQMTQDCHRSLARLGKPTL